MKLSSRLSKTAYDALTDVAKESEDHLRDELKHSGASKVIQFIGNLSTGFLSKLALTCLRHILKIEDSGEKLAKDVSKLVSAPLGEGMEQLHIAASLEPPIDKKEKPEEARHRQERYRDALRSLDQARQLASQEEIPPIDLLRGLACLRLPGAQAEARLHLDSYAEFCEQLSRVLLERADVLSSRLARDEKDLRNIPVYRGGLGGGGLVGMDIALSITKRAELVRRVESTKREISSAIAESQELLISSAVIRSISKFHGSTSA